MPKSFFGSPQTRIIFAADLDNYDMNARVLEQVQDEIDVIKVNTPLVFKEGLSVIRKLRDTFKKPIFADLKIADVPHTDVKIVRMVADNGGAAVMVHGFVGPDALIDCAEAANDEIGIIMQLELTNPGGKMFTAPIANDLAKLAADLNLYGTQAPGNRPSRIADIRAIIGPDAVIVCCGVGAQGGKHQSVLNAGGTYSIVGRAIYAAEDPVSAAQNIRLSKEKQPAFEPELKRGEDLVV
jgi:orotidine-5'-phosphate decarboxylase